MHFSRAICVYLFQKVKIVAMNIVSTVLCRKDIGNFRVSAQGKSKVICPWPPQVPCLFKIVETLLLFVASATDPELKCFKVRQKMSTLPQLAEARKNPGTSHVYLLCASCGAKSGVLITLADFSCCLHTLQQYDFIDEATRYIEGTAGKYIPLHH